MQNQNYIRKKITQPKVDELVAGIIAKDFTALSRGITLCESKKNEDRKLANELVTKCLPYSGKSIRIGITGVPGVGKSTFIESFGLHLIEKENKKVAVLAVDPSSNRSKGSILGDKTRMNELSIQKNAFIRPSPSSGSLGGVTDHSRETILLCEAAGFDTIIVETVGVGQSEIEVKEMTDFFLLLMLAGAGDDLQGIKRGIMEMADGMLINKADGENVTNAKRAKREYQSALHLFPLAESGWSPKVEICSAIEQSNLDVAWRMISEYTAFTTKNNFFQTNRKQQLEKWFSKSIEQKLLEGLYGSKKIKTEIETLKSQVVNQNISPTAAAEKIINQFKGE